MQPSRKQRVVVALPVAAEVEQLLRERFEVQFVQGNAHSPGLMEALAVADGLLCANLLPISAAVLDASPNLRVVSNYGVGFDNVDVPAATARGVLVCNTPGVLSEAVADLTLAVILAFSRRIFENAAYVRDGRWGKEPPPTWGFDLGGKTLGVIGLGRIGTAVAVRARAFGMNVQFYDVFDTANPAVDFCSYCSLQELLRTSDVVSVHTNLAPETFHLLSTAEFEAMKPTALLVNTSRGAVVDQAALGNALRSGQIAGAALDVLEREPPDPGEPLLQLPNVLILPHVGSATFETRAAMLDLAVRNLLAALAGEPPPACVNPAVLARPPSA